MDGLARLLFACGPNGPRAESERRQVVHATSPKGLRAFSPDLRLLQSPGPKAQSTVAALIRKKNRCSIILRDF